jgi:AcrR family transcriptional regulator
MRSKLFDPVHKEEMVVQSRGRPREFDPEFVLDQAIDLFWRHGYEGTSLADLTQSTGVNRPSLYAAFGNKEELFRKAVNRYVKMEMAYVSAALSESRASDVAKSYLRNNVIAVTEPGRPSGCLSIQGAMAVSVDNASVSDFLSASRNAAEHRFADRFRKAIVDGDLPAGEDAEELALYLTSVSSGIAVRAADGASRETLTRVADRALASFPDSRGQSES